MPSSCDIYLPNVFSPNGDNINDVFGNLASPLPFLWDLEIFDRSGNIVYASKDPAIGWDGICKGKECQVGVYVWKLIYQNSPLEESHLLAGDVTLIR